MELEVDPHGQDGLVFLAGPDAQRASADFSKLKEMDLDRAIREMLKPAFASSK